MNRLNKNLITELPADVALPRYNREQLTAGIVHLGIGAFHRAHQAFYTEAVLNQFGGNWGIVGSSLRSASVRDLMSQAALVGWFALVLGIAFGVLYGVRRAQAGRRQP